ncbi:hypothetical protein SNOG_09893 [Parastagonospora nodorum SN15]|uniref:Zn(2)-C6 fungal-type domain-containing protein n=1 Tax=Phaeosphaeria nodorum (strain SN15 / ATCC MYA-4574 / FGSC 10173) TaxID=321614 RepID=Q0UEC1_PHANO|nr:hypothetical protein SNOG_09893 [Parastagonospora nodorum SN15]EAT83158.2 hypothetical protein SNOG_09893 [Parastagonospora nodorum SN15]
MVYRGRPSTGCKKCRQRKVKCDERPDGCLRCAEQRLPCPGYDRNIDAWFHDETAKVLAKSKPSQRRPPSHAVSAIAKKDIASPNTTLAWVQDNVPPGYMLAPLVDQGITFFMTHYAIGLDQPSIASRAYSHHLSTDGFHPLVATTMTALGIAGVANLYMDSALKREATQWYLRAIKMANAAISSPTDVKKDTTLVAVNLLTMFEATFNNDSLVGWSNHVDGSALLVKLRGRDQLKTVAGRRMYLHTVGLVTINCMGKGETMPDYVKDINREVEAHLDHGDPRTAFFFLHQKTTDLRAYVLKQTASQVPDIINRALELDASAKSIFDRVSRDWDYHTVPCFDQVPGVFGSHYHIYPTHATAQTWNWVRYNRIYLHDIIRAESRRFFQNFRSETVDLSKTGNLNDCMDRLPIVRVSGGYSTVWALYVAGSMPTASAPSQKFVLHCLDRIEHEFGIMQASVFAKALRLKMELENSGETPLSLCPRYLPPDASTDVPHSDAPSKADLNRSPKSLIDPSSYTLNALNANMVALHVCNILVVGATTIPLEHVAGSHSMDWARKIKFMYSCARSLVLPLCYQSPSTL